jgi:hypothetical protein
MPVVMVAKFALSFVASEGVRRVATQIIKNNTTTVTLTNKILVGIGSLAVTSMVIEATSNHVHRMIDEVCDNYKEAMDKRKKTTEEE